MLSISHIFIIIFSLSALALILAIIEWFHLASLSNLNMNFEREVEKKSQEFDAFRKEFSTQHQNHTVYASPSIPVESSPDSSDSNQIQVMRNVGGVFEDTSQIERFPPSVNPAAQIQNNQKQFNHPSHAQSNNNVFTSNTLNSNQYNSMTQHPNSDNQPFGHPQAATKPDLPIQNEAQRINRNNPNAMHQKTINPGTRIHQVREGAHPKLSPSLPSITLYLYSDVLKDADFNGIWKNLTKHLSSGNPLAITIDLSGIHFVYQKEIGYLEKFCMYIQQAGGTLTLANCDNEIITLLKDHPQLYTKIRN